MYVYTKNSLKKEKHQKTKEKMYNAWIKKNKKRKKQKKKKKTTKKKGKDI